MSPTLHRYNYTTDEYDYRDAPTTDEEAKRYLPQQPAAQGLFDCHREMGLGILEAMVEVLTAVIGDRRLKELVDADQENEALAGDSPE